MLGIPAEGAGSAKLGMNTKSNKAGLSPQDELLNFDEVMAYFREHATDPVIAQLQEGGNRLTAAERLRPSPLPGWDVIRGGPEPKPVPRHHRSRRRRGARTHGQQSNSTARSAGGGAGHESNAQADGAGGAAGHRKESTASDKAEIAKRQQKRVYRKWRRKWSKARARRAAADAAEEGEAETLRRG